MDGNNGRGPQYRRVMEGEDDDEQQQQIYQQQQELMIHAHDAFYPLTPSLSYSNNAPPTSSSSLPSFFSRKCPPGSPRRRLCLTVSVGITVLVALFIIFTIVAIRLMESHHSDPAPNKPQVIFKMTLLGQTVLKYDIREDQPPDEQVLVSNWLSDWSSLFSPSHLVLSDLETALEGPFGGCNWRATIFAHIAPASTLHLLTNELGINVWSCANNHVWDLETPGIFNILEAFQQLNATAPEYAYDACAGIGRNESVASASTFTLVRDAPSSSTSSKRPIPSNNDGDEQPAEDDDDNPTYPNPSSAGVGVRIVSMASGSVNTSGIALAKRPGVNVLRMAANGTLDSSDLSRQLKAIDRAVKRRQQEDGRSLIAVVHHNHYINSTDPHTVDPWRRDLAKSFLDHGADLYVSHGVPYVQGIAFHDGKPIFYGLGNFIFQSIASMDVWGEEAYESVLVETEWICATCMDEECTTTEESATRRRKKPISISVCPVRPKDDNQPQHEHASHLASSAVEKVEEGVEELEEGAERVVEEAAEVTERVFEEMKTDEEQIMEKWLNLHGGSDQQQKQQQRPDHEDHDTTQTCDREHNQSCTQQQQSSPSKLQDVPFCRTPTRSMDSFDADRPEARPSPMRTEKLDPPPCDCGYHLHSLLLRPISLLLPTLSPGDTPERLRFNHSFGLPDARIDHVPLESARELLQRIQKLSKEFGTEMTIIEEGNHEKHERKRLYAKVDVPNAPPAPRYNSMSKR